MKVEEVEKTFKALHGLRIEPTILEKTLQTESEEQIRASIDEMKKNLVASALKLWHELEAECEKNGKIGTDPEGYITFEVDLDLNDKEKMLLGKLNQEIDNIPPALVV